MPCEHEGHVTAVQALLHAPQWLLFVAVSTHWVPHAVPLEQTQTPEVHDWPADVVQTLPQVPQLLGSIVVFVHVPLHAVRPPPQVLQADDAHVRREL
jgi:hypothetical protein